jgi:hypothetical protein
MAIYVYDRERDRMVDKATGELMNPEPLSGPFPIAARREGHRAVCFPGDWRVCQWPPRQAR